MGNKVTLSVFQKLYQVVSHENVSTYLQCIYIRLFVILVMISIINKITNNLLICGIYNACPIAW